jgi:hypothetical protein
MHAKTAAAAHRPGSRFAEAATSTPGATHLYLRRQKDTLVLTIEHRAAAAPDPLRLRLVTDSEADAHLAIIDGDTHVGLGDDSELDRRLLETLTRAPAPLGRTQLRAQLHVRNERLGDALARLATAGTVVREGDRWAVPVLTPQE